MVAPSKKRLPAVLCGLGLALLVGGARAEGAPPYASSGTTEPGTNQVELRYTMTLPADHDPAVAYPAVLALAPGPQNQQMVEVAHRAYWDAAEGRGWIVVSPVAPEGRLFFDGAESLIPQLLEDFRERFLIEGNAFHIAGISNGGIAAFRVAENSPELFCSILVAPGLPGNDEDFERLAVLRDIPVHMVVGEADERWVSRMRDTEARLRELGIPVELIVLPGEGHVIAPAYPENKVFEELETQRPACRDGAERRAAMARPSNSASD